jgi:hypothetical protein
VVRRWKVESHVASDYNSALESRQNSQGHFQWMRYWLCDLLNGYFRARPGSEIASTSSPVFWSL